jgi:putative nucleotidyltransferase with HDIG domain
VTAIPRIESPGRTSAHHLSAPRRRGEARRPGDRSQLESALNAREAACLEVVCRLAELIESSDHYTFGHCARVAAYAVDVARSLEFDDHEVTTVRIGAYLHDLGKVRVPAEILNKPGPLVAEESDLIREHPLWGVELLAAIDLPWDIKPIIRWHHERYDGSGYPHGLRGDEIPVTAQIVGIADAFDALTTTRSYRPAVSMEQAVLEMQENRHLWHPEVYRAFLDSVTAQQAQWRTIPWRRSIATVESIGSA